MFISRSKLLTEFRARQESCAVVVQLQKFVGRKATTMDIVASPESHCHAKTVSWLKEMLTRHWLAYCQ